MRFSRPDGHVADTAFSRTWAFITSGRKATFATDVNASSFAGPGSTHPPQ
jgi:hypothetical protein